MHIVTRRSFSIELPDGMAKFLFIQAKLINISNVSSQCVGQYCNFKLNKRLKPNIFLQDRTGCISMSNTVGTPKILFIQA